MQSATCMCFAAILACAYAQVYVLPGCKDKSSPEGCVFGTIGSTDRGLIGKLGYRKEIFNDHRGKMQGQAYGSRVLGTNGDSSHFGGKLDWENKNAQAAVEVSKQIGGGTSVAASGGGVWNVDKNTNVKASGTLNQEIGHGRPDIGVQAEVEHKF